MTPLYNSVVIERFRHPRYRGTLLGADATAEGFNPLCGDRVRFEINICNGRIVTARYRGDACAICLAAADVLAEQVEGRSCADARAVTVDRIREQLANDLGPSRLACVTLPVTTLSDAMKFLC